MTSRLVRYRATGRNGSLAACRNSITRTADFACESEIIFSAPEVFYSPRIFYFSQNILLSQILRVLGDMYM